MPYSITQDCDRCNACIPYCPNDAIQADEGQYWIDPTLCDSCESIEAEPRCMATCPSGVPVPLQPKKGRSRSPVRPLTNPELFLNGVNHPFASAMVMWELSNVLAQREALPWQVDGQGKLAYRREVHQGQGSLTFRLADGEGEALTVLDADAGRDAIASSDLRATCLNLIFAAYAVDLETPWETPFVVNDLQIERYLGLDKRRDLRKLDKLILIKQLVESACRLLVSIDWPQQGKVAAFTVAEDRLWHRLNTEYHFQEDEDGSKHLIGFTFSIRAGNWAEQFLNQKAYRSRTAFYQYGKLPQSLLCEIMGHWQQHEGAMRMLVWLLFKTRLGKEQRITVRTLMRVAYGEERVNLASVQSAERKRLTRTFEGDLEALAAYGLTPVFDPETYPTDIQPLWARLAEIPDDAEAALAFWTEDGSHACRLTDAAPRGKWTRLLNARLLRFNLPPDWAQASPTAAKPAKGNRKRQKRTVTSTPREPLSIAGSAITAARKRLSLSQRELAQQIGKSQSWIRDVEKGRFHPNPQDQATLVKILQLN